MEGSCCIGRAESSNCFSQPSFSYALPKPKRLCSNTRGENIYMLYIPEELVEEILLRLPAESLIMCKRVCKSWCNLINNPSFINKHLLRVTDEHRKMSSSYPRSFVLKWIRQELSLDYIFAHKCSRHDYTEDLSNHELSLVTVCDDGNGSDHLPCVVEQVTLPPFPVIIDDDDDDPVNFPNDLSVSHCNGITHMCDRFNEELVFLLNPVLREFKLLRTPYPSLEFSRTSHPNFTGSGFGYDPKANVYKYVKIYVSAAGMNPIALVYTMGTHSSWRVIKVNVEGDHCFLLTKGVYCKGAYYWWNLARGGEKILSFDMSEEKFRSIPIPNHLRHGMTKKTKRLEVWKESICFFFSLESSWFSSTFEMWLMVEGSTGWTKYLTIGPLVCITYPLAFWKDDELLMEGYDGRIVSYNIYTKKLRRVPLPKAVLPGFSFASLCLNSLVSV